MKQKTSIEEFIEEFLKRILKFWKASFLNAFIRDHIKTCTKYKTNFTKNITNFSPKINKNFSKYCKIKVFPNKLKFKKFGGGNLLIW